MKYVFLESVYMMYMRGAHKFTGVGGDAIVKSLCFVQVYLVTPLQVEFCFVPFLFAVEFVVLTPSIV